MMMQRKMYHFVRSTAMMTCLPIKTFSMQPAKPFQLLKTLKVYTPLACNYMKTVKELIGDANKELFNLKPIQSKEKEIKLHDHLLGCRNIDDVFELFLSLGQTNQLADMDAFLCMCRIYKLTFPQDFTSNLKLQFIKPVEVLSDTRFHKIFERTLVTSPYLESKHLAFLFKMMVQLGIPVSSSSMQHVINTIQKRINDFFPRDITQCIAAHRLLKKVGAFDTRQKELDHVLLLHLENLSVDENFFVTSLRDAKLPAPIHISCYFRGRASIRLRSCLRDSINGILLEYQDNKLQITPLEAILLKQYLVYASFRPLHRKMLHVATNALNQNEVSEQQREVLKHLDAEIDLLIQREKNHLPRLKSGEHRNREL